MLGSPCLAFALLLAAAGFSTSAWAVPSLFASLQGDVARTLPRGRFYLSYNRLSARIDGRYTESGDAGRIGTEFSRDLTWRDVIDGRPDRSEQLAGLLESYGIRAEDSAGQVTGDLKGRLDLTVPVIGYGITDRLGVFIAVPIQKVRIESRVSYRGSESGRRLTEELRRTEQSAAAHDIAASLNHGFEDEIAKAGYRYQESTERSGVGDLRMEIPYIFGPARGATWGLIGSLVLPTGSRPDPVDLYPLSTGQGRWMAGLRGVASRELNARVSVHVSGGALVPFTAERAVRVPRTETDRLSPDIDQRARLSGGVVVVAKAHGRYRLGRSWTLSSGLEHQSKSADSYRGLAFADSRYRPLGAQTAERLQSYFVNLDLNTTSAFLAGDFRFPFQMAAGYAAPLSGKNSLSEPYAYLQTSLFF